MSSIGLTGQYDNGIKAQLDFPVLHRGPESQGSWPDSPLLNGTLLQVISILYFVRRAVF